MKLAPMLIGLTAMAVGAFAQSPTPENSASPAIPTTTPTVTATASAVASASPAGSTSEKSTLADKIHKKVDAKLGKKHGGVHIQVDGDDGESVSGDSKLSKEEIPEMLIPLVGIIMVIVFGAPVLAMALLLYFGFSKTRMMHRTVRMMVEKGQPVPEALLNPPPHVRKRSDMRRGVVLLMIGIGLIMFFGAVNDWEGGVWTLGLIPGLIGLGYVIVWKLEGKPDGQAKADNPPPLP